MKLRSKRVTRKQRRLARRAAHDYRLHAENPRQMPPSPTLPEATTTTKVDPPVLIEHVTIAKVIT